MTLNRQRRILRNVVIAHSVVATIAFLMVHVGWSQTSRFTGYIWAVFLVIDFPSAFLFLILEQPATWLSIGPYGRYAIIPFLVVLIVGGAQWYAMTRCLLRNPLIKDKNLCTNCGYDIRASRKIGRCPECGVIIRFNRFRSSSATEDSRTP